MRKEGHRKGCQWRGKDWERFRNPEETRTLTTEPLEGILAVERLLGTNGDLNFEQKLELVANTSSVSCKARVNAQCWKEPRVISVWL